MEGTGDNMNRIGKMDVEPPPPPPTLNMPPAEPVIPSPPLPPDQPPVEEQQTDTGLPETPPPLMRDPPPDVAEIPSDSTGNHGRLTALITLLVAAAMIFFGGVMALNRPKPEVMETTKIECFTNAIRRRPKEARLYHNQGMAFTMLKEYELAVSDFRIALGFEPSRKDTAEHLRLVREKASSQ